MTFAFIFLISSRSAHAYLDPGTGSMLLQAVAGVFLAGTFTFKLWAGKIKEIFTKKEKIKEQK